LGDASPEQDGETIVDCRGLAARDMLPDLRGVRGERALIRTREVTLQRPVQLLHPRLPLYVVPWDDGLYMIGATLVETEDAGPVSVRSALELLGGAYAVHPAFAEAEVVDLGAGVRPAFPDNVPRAVVREGGRRILVNGAYRHGFLLGPVLARTVADYIESGATSELLVTEP
jgi:glycine oxidase